jgi:prepilin-type N-terminal cleavage/methylation domain-containing protein
LIRRGFTLVELLVTMALIALIGAFSVPRLTSVFRISLGSSAREIASTVKETYNAAVMTGRVHRVAFDLKKGEYWAESGPANMLLETDQSRELAERRRKLVDDKEKAKQKPIFQLDRAITRTKRSLPRGVKFSQIYTEQFKEPQTEGVVYAHFFPHGLAEKTALFLEDLSKNFVTLTISPIVAKTTVYDRQLEKAELREK